MVVLKIEGRLVGPWVDELKKTAWRSDRSPGRLEIDVEDLTFADDEGEKTLSWLHKMGARFQGRGLFSEYLFERLNIPLHSRPAKSTRLSKTVNGEVQKEKI